ncbi:DUF4148 domain-containing protein [Pararobbsia alpina]|uniref:DUF4148 domain-containing protein n=1 Tax=Pararobbsia alpina TaxID=621374 RepID=A0A6S7BY87_9BURK|nr:DUF4148 domain-containing protein [Pararobbsia alpina]CAB3802772.1 hypothetical protein LMG28138_05252 [Pararobbsia alpina]
MKVKLCAALIAAMLASSAFADGTHAYPGSAMANTSEGSAASPSGLVSVDAQAPAGNTRAQVRGELLEAERTGITPAGKFDYPPSAATIERNRQRFSLAEQYWASRK